MDFILIYPPSAERVAEFPVGGLFLAESLKSRGYTCGIICDRNISEIYDELDKLVDSDTIAIGISVVSTLIFKDTVHISKKVKELYQNIPLILGGQSITGQKEQILDFDPVDFLYELRRTSRV